MDFFAHAAQAATSLQNPLGTSDVRLIIGNIIKAALGFTGVIALLMFVYGGFLFLTSRGNMEQVKQGKNTLIWATIGLVVIFTAYTVVNALVAALVTSAT
jgi:hypothetical protein